MPGKGIDRRGRVEYKDAPNQSSLLRVDRPLGTRERCLYFIEGQYW